MNVDLIYKPQHLYVLFVFFIGFISLCLGACGTPLKGPPLSGHLPISAPRVANAGDSIEITVGPIIVSSGTPIGLIVIGTYGPTVYNTVFEAGLAHFVIPSKDTLQPGYLALIVAAEDARGETSIILHSGKSSSAQYFTGENSGVIAEVSTPNHEAHHDGQ